jgi:hypothetical protein
MKAFQQVQNWANTTPTARIVMVEVRAAHARPAVFPSLVFTKNPVTGETHIDMPQLIAIGADPAPVPIIGEELVLRLPTLWGETLHRFGGSSHGNGGGNSHEKAVDEKTTVPKQGGADVQRVIDLRDAPIERAQAALQDGNRVWLIYYADWCGYCTKLSQTIELLRTSIPNDMYIVKVPEKKLDVLLQLEPGFEPYLGNGIPLWSMITPATKEKVFSYGFLNDSLLRKLFTTPEYVLTIAKERNIQPRQGGADIKQQKEAKQPLQPAYTPVIDRFVELMRRAGSAKLPQELQISVRPSAPQQTLTEAVYLGKHLSVLKPDELRVTIRMDANSPHEVVVRHGGVEWTNKTAVEWLVRKRDEAMKGPTK